MPSGIGHDKVMAIQLGGRLLAALVYDAYLLVIFLASTILNIVLKIIILQIFY